MSDEHIEASDRGNLAPGDLPAMIEHVRRDLRVSGSVAERALPPFQVAWAVFVLGSSLSQWAHANVEAVGNVVPNPPVNGATVNVGDTGVGFLTIDQGSVLSSTTAIVGDDATGIGFALVTEQLSTWNTNALTIGRAGIGDLEINSGAFVNVAYPSGVGNFVIGDLNTGIGTVVVNGLGSFLSVGNATTVGNSGTGILRIENDGFVDATNTPATAADSFTIGVRGRVELTGGRLRTGTLHNNGLLRGSGWVRSVGDLQNNGRIAAGAGDLLILDTSLDNSAYIEINRGEIEFTDLVTNMTQGSEVSLRNGIARFRQGIGILNSLGVIGSVEGVNEIYGLVQNAANGRIVVGGGSVAVFHDNVMNSGSIQVAVGSEAIYLGNLTMSGAGASLSVGLSENDDGLEFGQISSAGPVALDGTLTVNLVDGYVPSAGDSFQLINGSNVSGSLSFPAPPPLPGQLAWDLDVSSSGVLLSVVPPELVGDYNLDGTVNAADYVVWRNSVGQMGPGNAADGNSDNKVDREDYLVWKSHYGQTRNGGPGGGTTVPEPSGLVLLLGGVVLAAGRRRRRL